MNQIIILIMVGVAGILVGCKLAVRRKMKQMYGVVEERSNVRDENMEKLRKHLLSKRGARHPFVTNNGVEQLLGVSDATATRDLDALERDGLLRQVRSDGNSVHYKIF